MDRVATFGKLSPKKTICYALKYSEFGFTAFYHSERIFACRAWLMREAKIFPE